MSGRYTKVIIAPGAFQDRCLSGRMIFALLQRMVIWPREPTVLPNFRECSYFATRTEQ